MEVILDLAIHIYPKDEKTNICVPFSLKKNYSTLEIISSYEPKGCEDRERAKEMILRGLEKYSFKEDPYRSWESYLPRVVSLITFSVDHKGQYLGCCHRQDNEQRHIISGDFSSPGFFRRAPEAGDWRVMLNVHALVSRDVCFRFKIAAHNEAAS